MPFKNPLGGFKADEKEYEKYKGKKGSEVYWRLMENVVQSLVDKGFIIRHFHPAYVLINFKLAAKPICDSIFFFSY
jgi:hypothetical protein